MCEAARASAAAAFVHGFFRRERYRRCCIRWTCTPVRSSAQPATRALHAARTLDRYRGYVAIVLPVEGAALFKQGLRERFPDLSEEEFHRLYLKRLALCHNRNC